MGREVTRMHCFVFVIVIVIARSSMQYVVMAGRKMKKEELRKWREEKKTTWKSEPDALLQL
jgi:uncharacterized membrane protein YbaN (DUF454 family)